MSETRKIQITSGDSLHTYGSIGTMDYTVRLSIRLDSLIDGEVLKTALESTQKRYPYLKLTMKKQGADILRRKPSSGLSLQHRPEDQSQL